MNKNPCKGKTDTILAAALIAALLLTGSCREKSENKTAPPAQPAATTVPASTQPAVPALPAKPARSESASLILLYTTGLNGELVDCGCPHHPRGGLARRAYYALGLKKAQPAVVQVDGGDSFFPPSVNPNNDDMKKKARAIAAAVSAMGIDAVNVGRQDLAAGFEFLKDDLVRPANGTALPLISANLVAVNDGQRIFPPYVIKEIGKAKVGIFGIFAEGSPADPRIKAQDPTQTARDMIAELRPKCDLVIGLYAADFPTASRMAQDAPGTDIIVAGDPHASLRTSPLVIGDSLVAQAGNRGMYIGRMDVTLAATANQTMSEEEMAGIKAELLRLNAQKITLQGEISKDPAVAGLYQQTAQKENELNRKLEAAGARLDYLNSLVSMDLELPQDPEVAKMVEDAGVAPRTPAPAK